MIAVAIWALGASTSAFAQGAVGSSEATFARPQATSEQKPSLGLKLGMANTDGKYDSALGYGIEAAFQPYIPFGVGVELNGYSTDGEGTSAALTRTALLGKAMYNFAGTIPVIRYSHVGAQLGGVWDNVNHNGDLNLGWGPLLGFDIPLEAQGAYTLGANANYLFVGGSKADVLAVNAIVKRWF